MFYKVLAILILSPFVSFSQPFQINGYVKDRVSGDLLPNAHVFVQSENFGVIANAYGYFSFTVNSTHVKLEVSFTGYNQLVETFFISSDTTINCNLITNNQIEEVEVTGARAKEFAGQEVGSLRLTGKELERIPSLFGEKDIVKALQLLPGIKMGKEGTSGLYIRGGTPGQNLMLLDGIPVYNVNHLFGFFSVFTPEAVKSVDVYKGAFPARYGGRISSVIDVKMREGNLFKAKADVTIGLLSSKAIIETPLEKGKSSVLIAARRTYADLFLAPFLKTTSYDGKTTSKSGYYFYDINVKLFRDMGRWGKLYFSNYLGRDKQHANDEYRSFADINPNINPLRVAEDDKYTYNWGNYTSSLRWNTLIGRKLFLNTTLFLSNYSFITEINDETRNYLPDTTWTTINYLNFSGVKDYGCFVDFDYYLTTSHQFAFGARLTNHSFVPGKVNVEFNDNDGSLLKREQISDTLALEVNTYLEDRIQVNDWWTINAGLHHSWFKVGNTIYASFQPRIRSKLELNDWSLKCSGGYMVQPVQNIVNNSNLLAVDIWVPSEEKVKPSTSLQFDAGVSRTFIHKYLLTVEAYWRKMNNIITYRSGESFFSLYENWYDKVINGNGKSFGLEIMARKTAGKTTGWVSYTWSKSVQQFNELNNGQPFPFSFDRRHYLTATVIHRLSKHVVLSGNWVFATGEPITLSTTAYNGDPFYGYAGLNYYYLEIIERTVHSPNQVLYINSVNNFRLPCYHRLDLGIDFTKKKKRGIRTWSFSVYNAYGRNNPYMVDIEERNNGKLVLNNSTLFRFLPSVSYRFQFK